MPEVSRFQRGRCFALSFCQVGSQKNHPKNMRWIVDIQFLLKRAYDCLLVFLAVCPHCATLVCKKRCTYFCTNDLDFLIYLAAADWVILGPFGWVHKNAVPKRDADAALILKTVYSNTLKQQMILLCYNAWRTKVSPVGEKNFKYMLYALSRSS